MDRPMKRDRPMKTWLMAVVEQSRIFGLNENGTIDHSR